MHCDQIFTFERFNSDQVSANMKEILGMIALQFNSLLKMTTFHDVLLTHLPMTMFNLSWTLYYTERLR